MLWPDWFIQWTLSEEVWVQDLARSLYCVLGQNTFLPRCLSPPVVINWLPILLGGKILLSHFMLRKLGWAANINAISTVQLFEWFYEPTWCTAAMFITMCSCQYNLGYWTCHLVCVLSLNFSNPKRWQLVLCCDNDNNIVIWVILRTLSKWLLRYVQVVCLNKLILKWITEF